MTYKHILLLVVVLFTGCGGITGGLTTSTSPLPPGVRGSIEASGVSCQYSLLGFIPITTPNSTQKALVDAKEDCDCEVLTDVTVDQMFYYWLLWSNRCIYVEGLGVPRSKL